MYLTLIDITPDKTGTIYLSIIPNYPEEFYQQPDNRKFMPYFDDFSKFRSTFGALHFEKSSKMAKNEEKACSTCVQPISRIDFWPQKPDFRDSVRH